MRRHTRTGSLLCLLALLLGGAGDHQAQAQETAPAIAVTGSVDPPLTLTAADLAGMPRGAVASLSGGIETRYEGVWMHEILRLAGVPLGGELRGPALATYILAKAEDGYQVVFSLGELDPAFADNQILVADTANGRPLFGNDGAFRIIAPREGRGARSVRMLNELEIVRLRPE